MRNNLRHDLDYATPEEAAIHLAYSRGDLEVDLDGYATEQWVLSKKYLTKKDLPEQNVGGGGGAPEDHDHDEYAPIEHEHDEYLPLSGGTLRGKLNIFQSASQRQLTRTERRSFVINGECSNGQLAENFFYTYHNNPGTPDAVNYNGKMNSGANIVNKDYVDKQIDTKADQDHNHSGTYVRGGFQITKSNGCFYIQ